MTYWIGNKNIKQYLTEDELKELEEIEVLKAHYQIFKNNYLMVKDKKDYYLNKKKSLMDIFINGVNNDFKNHRKLYMRKYRRNENGLTSREQKKKDLINNIKSLIFS